VGGVTANLIGSLSDTRAWKNKIEPSTAIYSWAMNNHWHTNYRAEQEGPTVFRYILWPHDGTFKAEEAAGRALECSQPLVVVPARGDRPDIAPLQISNPAVTVTAFKPSEDGKGWIVRLFGVSGKNEKATLTWAKPEPRTVWLSDASEKPLRLVSGPVEVPAWSIVTLRADLPE
jgi:alpha-mannosidase